MYTEKVMEHFSNPHNSGELKNANAIGTVGNAKCGDIMKMYMYIEEDIIKDISFKTFGCGAAIATSSVATDMVKGKTIEEALKITNQQVVDELGGLPLRKFTARCLQRKQSKQQLQITTNGWALKMKSQKMPATDAVKTATIITINNILY